MTVRAGLEGVDVEVADHVAWVTLSRPEQMNAITLGMAEALVTVLDDLERSARDDEVRVAVVRGAGDQAFCTGADLKQRKEMSEEDLWRHADLIRRFALGCYSASVPFIASIHGFCLGGGLEIAMACDLRVAADDASLGFTEVRIGAFPGAGGAVFTPRLVGTPAAKDLLYTGRRVSGTEAAGLGLVNRVVARDALPAASTELAATIAANGPLAVRALKRLLNHGPESPLADAFELSDALRRPLNSSQDYAEGLAAFAERRAPEFQGR
jgi:enoyl-CoA hydratase/carnithine racemase